MSKPQLKPLPAERLQVPITASPLVSSETFEIYCHQVQARLAEHAIQRLKFLRNANERLTRLLHSAHAVGDTALYNELTQHHMAVRELLESLNIDGFGSSQNNPISDNHSADNPVPQYAVPDTHFLTNHVDVPLASSSSSASSVVTSFSPSPSSPASSNFSSSASVSPTHPARPLPSNPGSQHNPSVANGHSNRDKSDESQTPGVPIETGLQSSQAQELQAVDAVEATPRIVRVPVRALDDIEADAAFLRNILRDWNTTYPLRHADTVGGELNVPNCLRLRAVACRMRRLEEEAGDTEVTEVTELARDIEDLLDEAGDEEYTVALDYEIEPQPTAYQWGELAERYEETAHAEEAFEWWIAHRAVLSVADVQALAESVAAIQQRFNRLLFRIGARDPFQQQLFDDLRIWAKEAQCYLYSLRPKVPIAELIDKVQTIDAAWEQAREPVRALEERQSAIQAIIDLVSAPDFGEQEDERRLQETLLQCQELRIPPTERRLRDALLPWAAFLESSEHCKEILDEIILEWERRHESGKTEVMENDPVQVLDALNLEMEAVRAVTRGKRCLILGGGMYREEHRRKIEDALQLAELIWPNARPSDPLIAFDTDLRRADIVALLTRYSRKEWKNAQDLCAHDGKKFVLIPTGNSVAQIVHHFHTKLL